jgi:transcriptional regulator with XRE-family HTH domain
VKPEETKNERQTEFCNYLQTLEDLGLHPAEVARQIGITSGAISQYRSGSSTPGVDKLIAMRQLVERTTRPLELGGEIHAQLRDLEAYAPDSFEAVKITIGILHAKIARAQPDARINQAAARLLKKSTASSGKRYSGDSGREAGAAPPPAGAADGPAAKKPARSTPASPPESDSSTDKPRP